MLRRAMMTTGLGLLLGCGMLGSEGEGKDEAGEEARSEAGLVDTAKKAHEDAKQAEVDAKQAQVEAQKAEAKKAEEDAIPEKIVVQETRTPVEPELAPMSRPEPEFVILPAPPFAQTLNREAPVAQGPKPTLKKVSDVRNAVIDEEKWFLDNALRLPTWEVPVTTGPHARPGTLPPELSPTYWRVPIAEAIDDGDFTIAIHAVKPLDRHHAVVRTKAGDVQGVFDFQAYRNTPADDPSEAMFIGQELQWAQVRDGVLFACTYHRTYAKSSGGLNAFITAIELKSGDLLWQSAPLVCNSRNFLVRDGWILTGYGFTAEPDFLYVLDAKTGEQASKIKVKSGPEFILEKDGKLYVRTYDRNMVFDLK